MNVILIHIHVYTLHALKSIPVLMAVDWFADDDNRIVLKALADASDCQRDYINACYVDVGLF